jgi:aldehyde:ferredoxin oxidoreductase
VIADQFIYAGSGIGSHIGIKKLKAISVRADWELKIDTEMTDFSAVLSAYTNKFFKKDHSTKNRRTCFGCLVGCGLLDEDQNFIMVEDDVRHLATLLPGLSHSLLRGFYKECLKGGLDVFAAARFLADQNFATIIDENIAEIFAKEKIANQQDKPAHLWEDAQLATNREYADLVLKNFRSCNGLVRRENIAMVKNCMPVCHRWDMSLDDMMLFLNKITGFSYSKKDFLTVGEKMIDMTMGFYNAIHYSPIDLKPVQHQSIRLPKLLAENIEDYIKTRNWDETGYPSKNRLKVLGVPNLLLNRQHTIH